MKRQRAARGQALVEFALIIPVFILLMVGIFDLGHVVWANNALSNSAREGARFAIVHGGSESTPCPVGPAPASDEAGATNVRGTPVTVTVTATIGLAAPELLGLGPFSLSASSTMLVNH